MNKDYIFNGIERFNSFIAEHCFFNRINTINSNGGIIYSSYPEKKLKVKSCIFYICSCDGQGGAIYFVGYNNIELLKICVNDCFASYAQKFAIIYSKLNNSHNLISITNCYKNNGCWDLLFLDGGNITLSYYNSSNNKNRECSGVGIHSPEKIQSIYCSIIDNYVSHERIIYIIYNEMNELSYYNIINNNSPKDGIVMIQSGKCILNNSILLNNQDTLFYSNGKLEIYNCKINHLNQLFFGDIITNNLDFTNNNKNTIIIYHYSTKYCYADYLKNEFTKIILFKNINQLVFIFIFLIIFNFRIKNNIKNS